MRDGIANAKFIPVYSPAERAAQVRKVLNLPSLPALGAPLSLTPNAPYGPDGEHLSFWKTSFVLGTPDGGEAGVNFWGIHNEGHINFGFTARPATSYVLDCRLLSAGRITYKIFSGTGPEPGEQKSAPLKEGHLLVAIPASDGPVSVELWPTPVTEPMGFLGCELSALANG
jgi:hypothetical protein